ncbi:MAG: hypothetical protein HY000_37805 [Planctomycetes bacterium]|nr:hypothetical protein [Planctomycetota bacterium]
MKLWDAATGQELVTLLKSHPFPESTLAFSPDGMRLVSAGVDRTIKLWDLATGRELSTFKGHSARLSPRGVESTQKCLER